MHNLYKVLFVLCVLTPKISPVSQYINPYNSRDSYDEYLYPLENELDGANRFEEHSNNYINKCKKYKPENINRDEDYDEYGDNMNKPKDKDDVIVIEIDLDGCCEIDADKNKIELNPTVQNGICEYCQNQDMCFLQ